MREKRMKKIILAGVLVMSMLLLPGCSFITELIDSMNGEPKTIESSDGVFTMVIPAGWEQPKQGTLNQAASIEAMNASKELYFTAIMENKADYDCSLEDYRDYVVDLNEDVFRTRFGEPTKTFVNGNDAYSYVFELTSDDGIKTYTRLFIVDTGNYFGQLYSWTIKSMETENKDIVDTISDTFQEK